MPQNGITARGISALADAFAVNEQLRIINLSDNTFTADGSVSMASVSVSISVVTMMSKLLATGRLEFPINPISRNVTVR